MVYAIDHSGHVQHLGNYAGPGGADELVIAPRRFGSVAGDALLPVDGGAERRRRRRVGPQREDATDRDPPLGLDPIAAIPKLPSTTGRTRAPLPGLYVNDDKTGYTYMAPAASLAKYAGDVIVGTESPRGLFWILKPSGKGFAEIPLETTWPPGPASSRRSS